MFHKILAAIDTPPVSRKVLDDAILLARSVKAELGLLYVLSPQEFAVLPYPKLDQLKVYPLGLFDNSLKCFIGHLQSDHHNPIENPEFNLLQSYARYAIGQGVATEFFQCVGDAGSVICDFASAWQADLLMVGHRSRFSADAMRLGKVCNYVTQHAPCSVYIIRPAMTTHSPELHGLETALH